MDARLPRAESVAPLRDLRTMGDGSSKLIGSDADLHLPRCDRPAEARAVGTLRRVSGRCRTVRRHARRKRPAERLHRAERTATCAGAATGEDKSMDGGAIGRSGYASARRQGGQRPLDGSSDVPAPLSDARTPEGVQSTPVKGRYPPALPRAIRAAATPARQSRGGLGRRRPPVDPRRRASMAARTALGVTRRHVGSIPACGGGHFQRGLPRGRPQGR